MNTQPHALSDAIRENNHVLVNDLLAAGFSANADEYQNGTKVHASSVLHQAILEGADIAIVKTLVAAGADVNKENFDKGTPLYYAARKGVVEVVQLLLEHGAQIDKPDHQNFTPLFFTLINGDFDMFHHLLSAGARVTPFDGYAGHILVLIMDIAKPDSQDIWLPILDTCLEHGADINGLSLTDFTPLRIAIRKDLSVFVNYCLEKGADVNTPHGKDPVSALYEAASLKDTTYLSLLLEHGGDVHVGEGYCNAILAASTYGSVAVLEMVIDKGADVNYRAPNGQTPLMFALDNDISVIQKLLDAGADASIQEPEEGKTALDWAREMEYEEAVALLAQYTKQS